MLSKEPSYSCVNIRSPVRDPREEMRMIPRAGVPVTAPASRINPYIARNTKQDIKLSSSLPSRRKSRTHEDLVASSPSPSPHNQDEHLFSNYKIEDIDDSLDHNEEYECESDYSQMKLSKKNKNRMSALDVTFVRATLMNQLHESRFLSMENATLDKEEDRIFSNSEPFASPLVTSTEVEKLHHTLSIMGCSEAEISKSVKAFKKISDVNAEHFISAMLESDFPPFDDDTIIHTSSTSSSGNAGAGANGAGGSTATNTMGPAESFKSVGEEVLLQDVYDDSKPSSSLGRAKSDSIVISSLSQMGFKEEHITRAMSDLNKSGVMEVDEEIVVSVLLGDCDHIFEDIGNSSSSNNTNTTTPLSQSPSTSQLEEEQTSYFPALPNLFVESAHTGRLDDDMIEIFPGKFEPILSGKKTMSAIRSGTSVSVDCIVCNTTLQCCPEAQYVVCPDCNVVSPLFGTASPLNSYGYRSRMRTTSSVVGPNKVDTRQRGVGLGFKMQMETM